MIRFDWPWAFILLAFIPLVVFFYFKRPSRAGIRFSSVRNAANVKPSLRQKLLMLPLILRIAALILLVVALARPQMGKELIKETTKGIAIEMVVDRSGSMSAQKEVGNKVMNRLEIFKEVFKEFVTGSGGKLPGRPNDQIGMVAFARYVDEICPLILSHSALVRFIDITKIVQVDSENATAIGDAIAYAAALLKTAEQDYTVQKETGKDAKQSYEIKSKIIILLTDGENNAGKRTPMQAAAIAKEWGIKVYTIGLTGQGWFETVDDPFLGKRRQPARAGINTRLLEQIAKETGGIFREAGDMNSLIDVYKEIDQLEKSEINNERFLDYKETFVVFAVLSLLLLILEFVLNSTVFRRIP